MSEIQQLKEALSRTPLVLFAYLFGSRATNKAGNVSDWDIAVYIEENKLEANPVWQKIKIEDDISLVLNTDRVQAIILNNLEAPLLSFNIINEGVVLKDSYRELREIFEWQTLRRFHDWRYNLDRHMNADILNRRTISDFQPMS